MSEVLRCIWFLNQDLGDIAISLKAEKAKSALNQRMSDQWCDGLRLGADFAFTPTSILTINQTLN